MGAQPPETRHGSRSKTRDLVLGAETQIRFLGDYAAYFTIPRGDSDGIPLSPAEE